LSGSEGEGEGSVLVVMAHPDDPEFFCGGTVANWTAQGRLVDYLLVTRGEKGSDEPGTDSIKLATIRVREQRKAAQVLGVNHVLFLDYPDGELLVSQSLRKDVARVVRQRRPKTLVTSDPNNFYMGYINHSDHRVAGQAALDAAWPGARSAMYHPELYEEEGLEPHKIAEVYIAGTPDPDTTVDVTQTFHRKIEALAHHRSQIDDIDEVAERLRERMLDRESPPNAPRYVERFRRIQLRQ
jgi:LmbE family N-acetylglucosaminyl deacetylase